MESRQIKSRSARPHTYVRLTRSVSAPDRPSWLTDSAGLSKGATGLADGLATGRVSARKLSPRDAPGWWRLVAAGGPSPADCSLARRLPGRECTASGETWPTSPDQGSRRPSAERVPSNGGRVDLHTMTQTLQCSEERSPVWSPSQCPPLGQRDTTRRSAECTHGRYPPSPSPRPTISPPRCVAFLGTPRPLGGAGRPGQDDPLFIDDSARTRRLAGSPRWAPS